MRFGCQTGAAAVLRKPGSSITMKEKIFKNSSKNKIGAKNSKFKDVLVKFMFNLEYGNICKY